MSNPRPFTVNIPRDIVMNESPIEWAQDHATGDWNVIVEIGRGPIRVDFAEASDADRLTRLLPPPAPRRPAGRPKKA